MPNLVATNPEDHVTPEEMEQIAELAEQDEIAPALRKPILADGNHDEAHLDTDGDRLMSLADFRAGGRGHARRP